MQSIESGGRRNNFNNARIKKIGEDLNKIKGQIFKAKNKRNQKKSLRNRKQKESF